MKSVELKQDGLYLDGENFFLISGDFHYFRTLPEGWERRLRLMKDFGLTAVTTYVAWNLHEPRPGSYCFEGMADLGRFLDLADQVGLKVVLRLSPYMCAEWEMGGLPSWLLRDRQLCLRSSDPAFLEPFTSYTKRLAEIVRPRLYTNGGPIILLGLENEYGSFGNDKSYLRYSSDLYRELGLNVPLISANGTDPFKYFNGTLEENWNGGDSMAFPICLATLDKIKEYQPDLPPVAGEAWLGKIPFWGKDFKFNRFANEHAEYTRAALDRNAFLNYYMFCGGTNFGFYNAGLLVDGKYEAISTSYDYDAPISEEGIPREKYFVMRDALDEWLGREKRPHVAPPYRAQVIPAIHLTECAPLFGGALDQASELSVFKHRTVCMEDLGQDYGFILYSSFINYTDDRVRHLHIAGLRDRATVYLDGVYLGGLMRDREEADISFRVPREGATLQILVENMGRVDYGYGLYDRKGILEHIRFDIENPDGSHLFNQAAQMGFQIDALPLSDLSRIVYGSKNAEKNTPCFYRGRFSAEAGVDTFLDMRGLKKGVVLLNGFNLGRYWELGPQHTLYVPGELIREENVIEVFEICAPGELPVISACNSHVFINKNGYCEDFDLL